MKAIVVGSGFGGLACAIRLAVKGYDVTVLDPRGELYTETNIGERLATRDLMASLREAGMQTEGPRPFDAKSKQRFAARLDSLLGRVMRTPRA